MADSTSLRPLRKFVSECLWSLSWLKKTAVALPPIIALFAPFNPSWPSYRAVISLVGVCELVVFACAFEFWRTAAIGKTRVVVFLSVFAIFVSFVEYAALWSKYIVTFPDDQENHIIVGTVLQPNLEELRKSNPVRFTDQELLDEWGRDPAKVWTADSLRNNRLQFLVLWLAFWAAIFSFVASFVAIQTRRASYRDRRH